jgi:ketosteroid isomerase-like protein
MRKTTLVVIAVLVLGGCATVRRDGRSDERLIAMTLDDFHDAASAADEQRYFGLLADDAVFLGTDATERWTKDEFRAYAHPYFSKGKGWTFVPRGRHISIDPEGRLAWFDEILDSASYGECRGTGALALRDGVWKIVQYDLTIPIPNDLAKELVGRIRDAKAPR